MMRVSKRSFVLRSLLASLLGVLCTIQLTPLSAADLAPPKVLGFERLNGTPALPEIAAGELLLGELNCTSCHAADGALASRVDKKPAPILSDVGNRVRPEYLRGFLNDPAATKAGTTMPNVLATLPEEERKEVVEALVHFLSSTGEVEDQAPRKMNANRGEALYGSVGCLACHDPRPTDGSLVPALKASISLGKPSRKFALPGLAKFLEDPLAVRPGARMPHMNLGQADSVAIASFLLNDLEMATGLEFVVVPGSFTKLPDFSQAKVAATGEAEDFTVDVTKLKENFALRFDGQIDLPIDGEYEFFLYSDDGSRLLIDAEVVIDHDGVHAPAEKSKKKKLTAGKHSVAVEYFEQSGGEELRVQVKLPGAARRPLADFIVAGKKSETSAAVAPPKFALNLDLAVKGRDLFSSLGCASCHAMKISGEPIDSKLTSKPLSQLKLESGCLAITPQPKTAWFPLSELQRKAIVAAVKGAASQTSKLVGNDAVHRQLTTFNCYACHARGDIGGVDEAHDAFFLTTTKEMGDEGRLPPPLTGVGAKLKPEWTKKVVAEGNKVRPYILTKMPKFGGNLPSFAAEVAAADEKLVPAAPLAQEQWKDRKFKAAGKQLVGAQGLGCIKCHVWGDKAIPGIQAMSLTTMAERLNPNWFHPYMINPVQFRPGTRMPTAWPDGKATLPSVLNGDTNKQVQAIWAYLLDGKEASAPAGLTTGAIELVAYDEAIIYRNFIEGAGPRAIAVGYPQKLNLAFDANGMRLALIWQNSFMDASKHWQGRGVGFQPPLGDNVVKFPEVVPFATLTAAETVWPKEIAKDQGYKFRGYKLVEKLQPVFLYSFGDIEVEDFFEPIGSDGLFFLRRTVTLTSKSSPDRLYFLAAQGGTIKETADGGFQVDNGFTVRLPKDTKAVLRESEGKSQLLIPVEFTNGKATITETFDW